jgi:hypothetical protein
VSTVPASRRRVRVRGPDGWVRMENAPAAEPGKLKIQGSSTRSPPGETRRLHLQMVRTVYVRRVHCTVVHVLYVST